MTMTYKNLPFGTAEKFNVVIEIPKGSRNKYEYDPELDAIKLEWVFTGGFNFVSDYGFVPQTLGGDGDPLDVFVLTSHPLEQGTVVDCRAIGMIEVLDRGEVDNKLLAVPVVDQKYSKVRELTDLDFDYEKEFREFLAELARQKDKIMEVKGFKGSDGAIKELESAHKNYA